MVRDINCEDKINEEEIKEIANDIEDGKIVVFPTETVYGIGTNGLTKNAIEKLFKIKKGEKKNQ